MKFSNDRTSQNYMRKFNSKSVNSISLLFVPFSSDSKGLKDLYVLFSLAFGNSFSFCMEITVMVCVFIQLMANILALASPTFYRDDSIFSSIEMLIHV